MRSVQRFTMRVGYVFILRVQYYCKTKYVSEKKKPEHL